MLNMHDFLVEMHDADQVNDQLGQQLDEFAPSIEQAFQSIRAILGLHGYSFQDELVYDEEGDELVLDLKDTDSEERVYLYVIFYRTDDGLYDFFAEVTDEEGIEELMSEGEDEE